MFGISFNKLLLLAAICAAIWFGFRYIGRVEQVRRALRQQAQRRRAAGEAQRPTLEAEDLTPCPRCGSYVTARGASPCGRGDCPWVSSARAGSARP